VLIVQFGSVAFSVVEGGLDAKDWGICLLIGFLAFPVRAFVNGLFIVLAPKDVGSLE
jgi:hypothetical protein